MGIGTGILIFFVAIVALVAELILYFVTGIGAAASGDGSSLPAVAMFFVGLMALTGAAGILAPISAIVESVAKKRDLGKKILLFGLGGVFVIMIIVGVASSAARRDTTATSGKPITAAISKPKPSPEKEYISKLEIKNIQIGTNIFDEVGVMGEVKNTGDKTLSKVKIIIYYLDKDGKPVGETDYYPVLVTDFGLGDAADPLKPGYVRKFGCKASDAPSEWAKKVRIEVVEVEFQSEASEAED